MKSLKKKFIFVLGCILILGAVLAACGRQEAAEASPTAINTATLPPSPTDTAVPTLTLTATQTATPEPTATLQPTDTPTTTPTSESTATAVPTEPVTETIVVEDGGFTFQSTPGFLTNVEGPQAGITSADDEILLYMIASETDTETTLEETLGNFVTAVSADMDELTAGDPYPFAIDDRDGLAVDVTGQLFGDDLEGRIAITAPDEMRIFIAFGFAVNDRWETEGAELFDAILSSVSFVAAATETADDSTTTPSDFPLPIPTGDPAAEWNGMPIMPQAIAGEGNDESYAFIVEASPNEIQTFYEQELSKLGWSLLGVGEGEAGAVLMVFQNGAEVASISILTVDSSTQYVFLVK